MDLVPEYIHFSQPDLSGVRAPLIGEYTVHFGLSETADLGMGHAEAKLYAS